MRILLGCVLLAGCVSTNEPQAATQLSIATPPSATAPSGVAFAQQPVLQLRDARGNAVSQSGVTVQVVLTAGGGLLGGRTEATTNAAGVASFTDLSIAGTIGSRTVAFIASRLTTATANVTVVAGPAAHVVKTVGDSQFVSVGKAVPIAPSVQVTDAYDNPVSGVGVVFEVAAGGGTVSAGSVTSNSAGIATVGSWTLGPSSWLNLLSATPTQTGIAGSPIAFSAFAFPPWTQVAVSGVQPAFATGVTYNRTRGKVTLVRPSYGVGELSPTGGTWSQLATTAPATGRVYTAVHEATQRILIISDQQGPAYWDYQTGVWTPAITGDVPSARFYPALVYDSVNARVLMYGGVIFGGSSNPVAEMYSWNGNAWTRLPDSPAGPRAAHRMAYDHANGRVFVHGGVDLGNPFGGRAVMDTWLISSSGVWQQMPETLNQPLAAFGMAYDERRQSLVLTGGTRATTTGYGLSTQTWEMVAGRWYLSDTPAPVGARVFSSLLFAPEVNGLLLYGNEAAGWNDVWLYAHP